MGRVGRWKSTPFSILFDRPQAIQRALSCFITAGAPDARDLYPLIDILDPERRLVGLCPQGPLALPPGGAHWYVVRRVGFPDPETFWPTFGRLSEWFDSINDSFGVDVERTLVGGFSQGAVMTYALSLTRGRSRPLGLLCFSGFVPKVEGSRSTSKTYGPARGDRARYAGSRHRS